MSILNTCYAPPKVLKAYTKETKLLGRLNSPKRFKEGGAAMLHLHIAHTALNFNAELKFLHFIFRPLVSSQKVVFVVIIALSRKIHTTKPIYVIKSKLMLQTEHYFCFSLIFFTHILKSQFFGLSILQIYILKGK
jgi:hypothetical protein